MFYAGLFEVPLEARDRHWADRQLKACVSGRFSTGRHDISGANQDPSPFFPETPCFRLPEQTIKFF